MLSLSNNLGEWITRKWGDQDSLAEKLKVSRATVSAYKTGRINIPPKIQDQLRKMGYDGPWPRQEAQAAGARITREEFDRLRDDLEDACAVISFLLSQVPAESRPGVLPKRFR